jgi:hypothetical protein
MQAGVTRTPGGDFRMRIVDLSMTVEECDSAPFAKEEYYFKLKPIVKWRRRASCRTWWR